MVEHSPHLWVGGYLALLAFTTLSDALEWWMVAIGPLLVLPGTVHFVLMGRMPPEVWAGPLLSNRKILLPIAAVSLAMFAVMAVSPLIVKLILGGVIAWSTAGYFVLTYLKWQRSTGVAV